METYSGDSRHLDDLHPLMATLGLFGSVYLQKVLFGQ